jgi:parallel beta-helix repeat protein
MREISTKGVLLTARRTLASAASLFLISLGIVAGAGPAQAGHVACGQTILVNTVLDSNLTCNVGLTIGANNVTLDMAGFTLTGNVATADGPGIQMTGRTGVTIKNGTVNLWDAGIAITGGSGNTVTGMRILDNRGTTFTDFGDGIILFSSNSNRVTNNQVVNNGPYDGIGVLAGDFNVIDGNQVANNNQASNNTSGIRLENAGFNAANDNVVTNNQVSNSGLDGIQVFAGGSRNQIKFNTVVGSPRDGINVFAGGANNVIEGNNLRQNGQSGIRIRPAAGSFPAPSGNQILRNISFGNVQWDLRDDNPNCGTNQWHGNQGQKVTPPCTLNP